MTRLMRKMRTTPANAPAQKRLRVVYGSQRDHKPSQACTLSDIGADWADAACLDITRAMLKAIAESDPHGWVTAFELAEQVFDAPNGPVIAILIGKVVRAIRTTRCNGFHFNAPCCAACSQHLTTHEAQLIAALRALRNQQVHIADVEVRALSETSETGEVMLWLRELAMALPQIKRTRLN